MSKFDQYLTEQEEAQKQLQEDIQTLVEENAELFEDAAEVAAQLGGVSVIPSSAIARFATGEKDNVKIVMLLMQNIDKFPRAEQKDAIKKLYAKYEPQIKKIQQYKSDEESFKATAAKPRQYDDGWGGKFAK